MLQTKYISIDDFDEYFPEIGPLREELGGEQNALAFLTRIEDRMEAFIDSNFNKSVDRMYPIFSDYQKKHYKLALLEQAIYIFKESDVSVNSGYDFDKGEIISRSKIRQISIAPNAVDNLRLCGLWNRNLRRYGYGTGVWFPW